MNWLREFRFEQPWLLLLLLLLPVLAYLRGGRGGSSAITFSSLRAFQQIGRDVVSKTGRFLANLTLLGMAVLIIGLARPQTGHTTSHRHASGIDIMILIDVSSSMLLEDFTIGNERASRVETIKYVTKNFIEGRPDDRIGIVAFASEPFLVSPLTLDHDWLLKNLSRLKIGLVDDGTAIGSAIASGCNRLKDRSSKSRVIVLLTDGDNNAGKISPITAAEAAKAIGVEVFAIGAGTDKEAPYPTGRDMFGRTQYELAKFGFDEASLKKIAEVSGGHYYRAADLNSLQSVFKDIDRMEKSTVELTQYTEYNDLFPWFVGSGLALLAVELILSQTLWRRLP